MRKHRHGGRFRCSFVRIEYACREPDGSMKLVPLDSTRQLTYCPHCIAKRCLISDCVVTPWQRDKALGEALTRRRERDLVKERDAARVAELRSRGLGSRGQALVESCWNCTSLRQLGGGYVCFWRPGDCARSQSTMSHRRRVAATGCQWFEMRLVMEVPLLEANIR